MARLITKIPKSKVITPCSAPLSAAAVDNRSRIILVVMEMRMFFIMSELTALRAALHKPRVVLSEQEGAGEEGGRQAPPLRLRMHASSAQ